MENNHFTIRRYSYKELALLYTPHVEPNSAARILRQWINKSQPLQEELKKYGWQKGNRYFTPLQVAAIIDHIGKPF